MSDEILLYLILLLMLVLAVGALVPSLLRVGREEASVEREDKAYGSAVTEALRRQRAIPTTAQAAVRAASRAPS